MLKVQQVNIGFQRKRDKSSRIVSCMGKYSEMLSRRKPLEVFAYKVTV